MSLADATERMCRARLEERWNEEGCKDSLSLLGFYAIPRASGRRIAFVVGLVVHAVVHAAVVGDHSLFVEAWPSEPYG